MPKNVKGVDKLVLALKRIGAKSKKESNAKYTVSYSAPYAIFVHERTDLRHESSKSAKFLEKAAREQRGRMAQIVAQTVKNGGTIDAGNALAALHLKKESQLLCPVSGWDPVISPLLPTSGTLHNSAKVTKESGGAVSTVGPTAAPGIKRARRQLKRGGKKRGR